MNEFGRLKQIAKDKKSEHRKFSTGISASLVCLSISKLAWAVMEDSEKVLWSCAGAGC